MRSGFTFCGITFEEYRGKATDPEGNVSRFIERDTGHEKQLTHYLLCAS
jgi:hypothetical protein